MIKNFTNKALKNIKGKDTKLHKTFIEMLSKGISSQDSHHFDQDLFESMMQKHWSLSKERGHKGIAIDIHCTPAKSSARRKTIIDIVSKDAAFLVDSVAATINEHKYLIEFLTYHSIFVSHSKKAITSISAEQKDGHKEECHIHIHIHEVLSDDAMKALEKDLRSTIQDVFTANRDWKEMLSELKESRRELELAQTEKPMAVVREYCDFLDYLYDNNFTLLGYKEYSFTNKDLSKSSATEVKSLGLLRSGSDTCKIDETAEGFPRNLKYTKNALPPVIASKTKIPTTVHRRVPMDVVAVKQYDDNGKVIGEKLFLGLFTSVTYSRSVHDIPYLRLKVKKIIKMSKAKDDSHNGKALRHILEKYPRDELFQTETSQLYSICTNILRLQERQRIALFVRKDVFSDYISCMVYVPRERFGTSLRKQIIKLLEKEFNGSCTSFFTSMDDSVFARGLFRVDLPTGTTTKFDIASIEEKLQELGKTWAERLSGALDKTDYSEIEADSLTLEYGEAFPINYTNRHTAAQALFDIQKIEDATQTNRLQLDLYKPKDAEEHQLRLKIYNAGQPIILSDVMPILGNLGLRAISELPFEITANSATQSTWIHDFLLETPKDSVHIELSKVKDIFEDAFTKIWYNQMESDPLNKLVLGAQMPWRDVVILRAYTKYMRQARAPHSQSFIMDALTKHTQLSGDLISLFHVALDPAQEKDASAAIQKHSDTIIDKLQDVDSLNEDRVIRGIKNLIDCTLRTNFYQSGPDGAPHKDYLSLKLNSKSIENLPKPAPFREIFVYSTTVEGVHLRGDKIARGGLRWSDRHEDFRTEVLGLMKAQMVKNSVIVPMGSKGGFVVKIKTTTRDDFMAAGIECYKTFIRGLLDITDNLNGDKVIPPKDTVRRDGDDPYLVVAADKGTATFSDIANGLSQEYGFWLDDAFASGGSAGYDHKKMGITARGAWESVKLHFRQLNHNTQTQAFDVIGCGDMGGDVFGNGMLLSEQIRLIGAFNHMHIFCDPDPDAAITFKERKRLFESVSGWGEYNEKLLSKGGRIYSRAEKSLKLTPEIMARFDIEDKEVPPSVLIKAILKARADLLWFGGIGTYIKARTETDADVGDKANDALRINAEDLRAKVIGEGANLGTTQLGRIEFSKKGGKINTDFIDNSGGVDSSDHEVNIKILMSAVMKSKKHNMDIKARNTLLEKMTSDIENHVLRHNYQQAQAVSLTEMLAADNLQAHDQFIQNMERDEGLDRKIEFLPDLEEVQKRQMTGKGLTRPELSVLISYAKIALTKDLLKTSIPDNPDMQIWLFDYFPKTLRDTYKKEINAHKLKREIIAMAIANSLINRLGPTFIKSTMKKTGMTAADIVSAYMVTREIFDLRTMWDDIESLDNQTPANVQLTAMLEMAKLIQFSIHWLLTRHGRTIKISKDIKAYKSSIAEITKTLQKLVPTDLKQSLKIKAESYIRDALPPTLAKQIAALPILTSALDITKIANDNKAKLEKIASTYFSIGERFNINWLRTQAQFKEPTNIWDKEATAGLINQLYGCQAGLTKRVLKDCEANECKVGTDIESWIEDNAHLVNELDPFFKKLNNTGSLDLPMLVIAEQRLRNLFGG